MKSQVDTIQMIKTHEGLRFIAYQCSENVWTIGYGHTRGVKKGDLVTLGEATNLFFDDLVTAIGDAMELFPLMLRMTHNRQAVLIDMSFNMGIRRLRKFKAMRAALEVKDFNGAAREMKNSQWAKQVGDRAQTLIKLMEEG